MSFYFKDGKKGDSWKEKEQKMTFFYLKMNSYFLLKSQFAAIHHKMLQIIVLQRTALEETDSINFLSVDDPQKLPKDQQDGKQINK